MPRSDRWRLPLSSVGLKLKGTKTRVLPPHRTVELLGFEITTSGTILPGRRALLRLLRNALDLPPTDRQLRLATALPYWLRTVVSGFSRFDLLHRAVDSQATRPFSSTAVRSLSQTCAVESGGLPASAGGPLCEGDLAAASAAVSAELKTHQLNGKEDWYASNESAELVVPENGSSRDHVGRRG